MSEAEANAPPPRTIVYVGPTLAHEEVLQLLPGCIIRGPVRRGDLYRDRVFGAQRFVILDGVFFQALAVSPREIVDVIRDGASCVGAASLGAIRAAECWPAGMRGHGVIYRSYRLGWTTSDDDVAITFNPEAPRHARSVALFNVRYAARQALRDRQMSVSQAREVVARAEGLHFSERFWPSILRELDSIPMRRYMADQDLKARDARLALRAVALEHRSAVTAPPPVDRSALLARAAAAVNRERPHELTIGGDRSDFLRWLYQSGRYRRYSLPAAAPLPGSRAHATEVALSADALLAELSRQHELGAELATWKAIEAAAARSLRLGLAVSESSRLTAEAQIASEHGYACYADLMLRYAAEPAFCAQVASYGTRLALAKAAVASS